MSAPSSIRTAALSISLMTAACGTVTEPQIVPEPTPVALVFSTSPAHADGGAVAEARVSVVDADGVVVESSTAEITLTLTAAPTIAGRAGALTGTLAATAVNGVATFSDLVVDRPGTGYVLEASAPNLGLATSNAFDLSLTFTGIDAGDDVVCGLTAGGTWCWGRNGQGQLGAGSSVPQDDQNVPVRVAGSLDFVDVAVSNNFSSRVCGVTSAEGAYCWGEDRNGELGNGIAGFSRDVPTAVAGGLRFASFGMGRFHTCGLTPPGSLLCWGNNQQGEIGLASGGPSSTPLPIRVGDEDATYVVVTGGRNHTCALDQDGIAYCWGDNRFDQLGAGPIGDGPHWPTEVDGGHRFVGIDAGDRHTCAWTAAGDAYCWGLGSQGKLGDDNGSTDSDVPVLVAGGHSWQMIDTGAFMACGLTTSGATYCWGDAGEGSLGTGDGRVLAAEAPVLVSGGHLFQSVSVGEAVACGLTPGGDAYCWGKGSSGQLGDGTDTSRDTPQQVVQG